MQDCFASEDMVRQLLKNVSSLLKPGGYFFGATPDSSTIWFIIFPHCHFNIAIDYCILPTLLALISSRVAGIRAERVESPHCLLVFSFCSHDIGGGYLLRYKYQKAVEGAMKAGSLRANGQLPRVKTDLYSISFEDDRYF